MEMQEKEASLNVPKGKGPRKEPGKSPPSKKRGNTSKSPRRLKKSDAVERLEGTPFLANCSFTAPGWVWKCGTLNTKKRYCVLSADHQLRLFNDEAKNQELASIDLHCGELELSCNSDPYQQNHWQLRLCARSRRSL